MMVFPRRFVAGLAVAALAISLGSAQAQTRPRSPVTPEAAPAPPAPAPEPVGPRLPDGSDPPYQRQPTRLRDVVRVGGPFDLAADDSAMNVTVIAGDALIAGRIERDVVVVLGTAEIAASAIINGSLTVIGGNARVREGAYIRRDLAVVGGELDAPLGLVTRGDSFVLDTRAFGGRLRWLVDWLKRGLLFGRLIVADLGWMWLFVAVWFFVNLLVAAVFESPARKAAGVIRERPISSLAMGLATLVLVGPISVLLAVSVIGALVVPFVLIAVVAAWTIGRVATARWLGSSILTEHEASKSVAMRSVVIGLLIIAVFYALPILGLVVWASFGVIGLGATALTFINAYRRENPLPTAPPPPRYVAPPVPPYVTSTDPQEVNAMPNPIPVPLAVSAIPSERRAQGLATFPHAMFLDRLAGGVLDLILILLISAMLDISRFNVVLIMFLAYQIGFLSWKGTTVGGIILQLRVVRTDGEAVRGADALVRSLASVFSAVVLGLGFLWIMRDPERQAWHDRIAGTYVVKVPREWPV